VRKWKVCVQYNSTIKNRPETSNGAAGTDRPLLVEYRVTEDMAEVTTAGNSGLRGVSDYTSGQSIVTD
jgi:hypothetical protein